MIGNIVRKISNIPGWKTNRRILVIESDDWGSIRMPSQKTYLSLKNQGFNLGSGHESRYNKYDTLASATDLQALYETLSQVEDKNGKSAKFTALSLVANPDFEKIKACNYASYHYELFTQTLDRYNQADAFPLWKEGIKNELFYPEFHGREHINIQYWLRELQREDKQTKIAFDYGMWGYNRGEGKESYQAAFDLDMATDLNTQHEIVKDGLKHFKEIHGYKARFFVPPNGPINNKLEKTAAENGIKFISSPKIQREALGGGRTRKHFRFLGMKNKNEQIYITRNVFFEPSEANSSQVDAAIKQIELAFQMKKPAILSSHRVNYIGVIDEQNRKNSLLALKTLLTKVIKNWPDVEFMTSTELGDTIYKSKSSIKKC